MIDTVLSIVALVVSIVTAIYAASVSRSVSNREVTNTAITDYYASMRDLTKLQMDEWRLAHLFEVVDNYATIVGALEQAASESSETDLIMLRVKERAAALTIFGLYEHVLYQMEEVEDDGDTVRARFLHDAADYFTQRLLPNPRLRYLWAKNGGNLECEFEGNVRAHYCTHVDTSSNGLDEVGPYGTI
jgi:hypothetical protein